MMHSVFNRTKKLVDLVEILISRVCIIEFDLEVRDQVNRKILPFSAYYERAVHPLGVTTIWLWERSLK